MTLYKKTLIVIGIVLVGMVVALYALAQLILEVGFLRLEEQDTSQNLERAANVLNTEITNLHTTTTDWAHWDDSYHFVQDSNATYISSNMNNETFRTNSLDVVVFLNTSGQIVFAKGYDRHHQQAIPVSSDLVDHLSNLNLPDLMNQEEGNGVSGMLLLPEDPLMIAIVPILQSDLSGTPRGLLVFARYLDSEQVADLADTSRLSLLIYRLDTPNLPNDVRSARTSLLKKNATITPLNQQTIAGYGLITDLEGNPILVLRVAIPRDIYQQGQSSLTYFLGSMVLIGLVFGAVTLLLLEKMVLSRLASLSATVTRIRETGDLAMPIEVTGQDELASLAEGLKGMLSALVQSQTNLQRVNDTLEQRVVERTSELDHARERVETILNSSRDVIILASAKGYIQQVNPTFDQVFDCGPDEYLNTLLTDLVRPDDIPALTEAIQQGLSGNAPSLEVQFIRKGSQPLDTELHIAPILDHRGHPTHLVCNLHDLTRHKQIEQTLQRAVEHERELNNLKSRFVSMASHEFRNPLAVIQMTAHSISHHYAKFDESQREAQFKKIDEQVQHMLELLNEVLAIGRIQSGRMEYKPEAVNLHHFCQTIVADVGTANDAEDRIQYTGPNINISAFLDPMLLQLILANLLTNALKYAPSGSPIEFTVTVADNLIRLQIHDNGIGIPAHELHHLYEPFHRAGNVGTIGGTGLGLYITKQAVELHDGIISCESQEGKGTTFTVEFPIGLPQEAGQIT